MVNVSQGGLSGDSRSRSAGEIFGLDCPAIYLGVKSLVTGERKWATRRQRDVWGWNVEDDCYEQTEEGENILLWRITTQLEGHLVDSRLDTGVCPEIGGIASLINTKTVGNFQVSQLHSLSSSYRV